MNATVPVRALEFARKRHKVQARNGMDYSLKGLGSKEKKMSRDAGISFKAAKNLEKDC
jgi:hypothetical protein